MSGMPLDMIIGSLVVANENATAATNIETGHRLILPVSASLADILQVVKSGQGCSMIVEFKLCSDQCIIYMLQ
eukprot:scaffold39096_cov37-Prasinocladus_malaysianus.AAC.1